MSSRDQSVRCRDTAPEKHAKQHIGFAAADAALYRAKDAGRDQVRVSEATDACP